MQIRIRSFHTIIEERLIEAGKPAAPPLRKVASIAVIENPYTGRFVDDLHPLIEASAELGLELSAHAVHAMNPFMVESYGKGAIVGMDGEQEHANALITTTFAEPLRQAVGGGKAWISSFTKRAAPGTSIDIPLANKDALYVRSHYDGMTLMLPDSPQADEIAVIICLASRGRINARVGGLTYKDAKRQDGLS